MGYAGDFIEITEDAILKEARTEDPDYCNKAYIVYISPCDRKIHVNTDFQRLKLLFSKETRVRLCVCYDRSLCETVEEYRHLPVGWIERQAYYSWMDGAR